LGISFSNLQIAMLGLLNAGIGITTKKVILKVRIAWPWGSQC